MKIDVSVRARDLMQTHLVTFLPDTPVQDAIQALEENEIGGAPVTDSADRPIGFFSVRDVARTEHLREGRLESDTGSPLMADVPGDESDEGMVDERLFYEKEGYSSAQGTVEDWMGKEVVSARPEASLRELCRTMASARSHHVVVLEGGVLRGLVSSMDVVRFVAEGGGTR